MAIYNCLFAPTSENTRGFSVFCVIANVSANPRNDCMAFMLFTMIHAHAIHPERYTQTQKERTLTEFLKYEI